MEGCALVTLEHPRGGALPAVGGGGRADLRQHRVADPRLRRNTLDGEDLGESRGTGYAHLVVLRVIQDERAPPAAARVQRRARSEEHTSELQSPCNLVCRLLLEKKNHGVTLAYCSFIDVLARAL